MVRARLCRAHRQSNPVLAYIAVFFFKALFRCAKREAYIIH